MQILIVEDEEKIANFLRRGLLEEGYAVDIAGFLTFLVAGCWLLWGCDSSAAAQKLSHKMGDIGCFGGQEIAGGLLKRRFGYHSRG